MWETRSTIYQGTEKAVSLFQAILNRKYITQILPRKVKLSQCLIKHHATMEQRGVNPLFHTFLPWVIDGGVNGQLHAPASLPPSPPHKTHAPLTTEYEEGHQGQLPVSMLCRKISCRAGNLTRNPQSSMPQPSQYADYTILASDFYLYGL